MYRLTDLNINDLAEIVKLNLDIDIKKRLNELGVFKNVLVKCIYVSPFHDPKAYLINDTLIALRNNDAKQIEVRLLHD